MILRLKSEFHSKFKFSKIGVVLLDYYDEEISMDTCLTDDPSLPSDKKAHSSDVIYSIIIADYRLYCF